MCDEAGADTSLERVFAASDGIFGQSFATDGPHQADA